MEKINKAYAEYVEKNPTSNAKAHFAAGYAAGVEAMTAPHPLPTPISAQDVAPDDENQEEFELVEPQETEENETHTN